MRYDAVNAMLLNEFLKEHRKVEEQEATIAQLNEGVRSRSDHRSSKTECRLDRSLKSRRQIQKVSAQLEASKPAPQVVNNP